MKVKSEESEKGEIKEEERNAGNRTKIARIFDIPSLGRSWGPSSQLSNCQTTKCLNLPFAYRYV